MAKVEVVALGTESTWQRKDNRYPDCSCQPWRYSPSHSHLRPSDPGCPEHGWLAEV